VASRGLRRPWRRVPRNRRGAADPSGAPTHGREPLPGPRVGAARAWRGRGSGEASPRVSAAPGVPQPGRLRFSVAGETEAAGRGGARPRSPGRPGGAPLAGRRGRAGGAGRGFRPRRSRRLCVLGPPRAGESAGRSHLQAGPGLARSRRGGGQSSAGLRLRALAGRVAAEACGPARSGHLETGT